ncbi:glutamate 5-kinase [Nanoarchaeota archaeon]
MRDTIKHAKRIVIKIGTSVITDKKGRINSKYMKNLAKQIMGIKRQGKEIIMVSSGAIGSGMEELQLNQRPRLIPLKQATAAIGQPLMMQAWRDVFKKYKQSVAQLLITYKNFSHRETYLNLRNALGKLLALGAIPVVNENDVVSIEEIDATFGDNDKLSSMVATRMDADLLIILSDVDGLYDHNPKRRKDAKLINTVEKITKEIEKMAFDDKSSTRAVGGMKAKIEAAKICMEDCCQMIIADGSEKNILTEIFEGEEIGTIFLCSPKKLSNKEKWISHSRSKGSLIIDDGAENALKNKRSLLPSGVKGLKGSFEVGDVVTLINNKKEIGKGLTDYSSSELKRIKGKKTDKIEKILGYKNYDSVIRRENLIIKE